MERPKHIDTPPAVREQAVALSVAASRVAGILRANAALPEMRERAKAELLTIAENALALRRLL
jgi:hypothetical protein